VHHGRAGDDIARDHSSVTGMVDVTIVE